MGGSAALVNVWMPLSSTVLPKGTPTLQLIAPFVIVLVGCTRYKRTGPGDIHWRCYLFIHSGEPVLTGFKRINIATPLVYPYPEPEP